MAGGPRFLVVDGYNKEARVELQAGGQPSVRRQP